MLRYAATRLIRSLALIAALMVLVFVVTQVIGDPVGRQLPLDAGPEEYERRQRSLGLDRPMGEQFSDYIGGVARLDFGDSFATNRPAMDLVLDRLPNTLLLVAAGMFLAGVLGISLGVMMGIARRHPWVDRFGTATSLVALSLPQFWVGLLLILVFAVWLGWLPSSGIGSWQHVVLPAVTLSLASAGRLAQITRSTLRDELAKPYVRTARAKGLPQRSVVWHSFRNVGVPVTTIFGFEAVTALAGYTILVETVFAWPGIGRLLVQAVNGLDLPLTAAAAFVVAAMVILANTAIDICYRILDPRIGAEGGAR